MTLEELIAKMEKAGWRVANLSYIGNAKAYSCFLERKKPTKDGSAILAFNRKELHAHPMDAMLDAWKHACDAPNPRVVVQPETDTLRRAWARLGDALEDHRKALTGEVEETDDYL